MLQAQRKALVKVLKHKHKCFQIKSALSTNSSTYEVLEAQVQSTTVQPFYHLSSISQLTSFRPKKFSSKSSRYFCNLALWSVKLLWCTKHICYKSAFMQALILKSAQAQAQMLNDQIILESIFKHFKKSA